MLDVQKAKVSGGKLERNIKTAMLKHRNSENTLHVDSAEMIHTHNEGPMRKPMTASGKRHHIPFGQ